MILNVTTRKQQAALVEGMLHIFWLPCISLTMCVGACTPQGSVLQDSIGFWPGGQPDGPIQYFGTVQPYTEVYVNQLMQKTYNPSGCHLWWCLCPSLSRILPLNLRSSKHGQHAPLWPALFYCLPLHQACNKTSLV
jgi:hypothetical protein